ncbi:MAG: pitrilysin family protein [Ignavibacteriota bacterium]
MKNSNSKIQFTEYDLPNGMHVILSPSTDQPIVAVNLWYHVGSKDEDPSRTGFAHLFEHLMFQGSANVPKAGHFTFIQNAGGTLNATTSFDRTNYFESLPAQQLELALWLESDRMLSLNINSENFENQRAVVKEERRQRYDNQPYGRVFETILASLYPTSGYHWSTIGSMQHLDETSLPEVQAFHTRWYVPNNASLAISGEFDVEDAKKLVERYFGTIAKGSPVARPEQHVTPITTKIDLRMEDAVTLPSVAIAFQSALLYSQSDYAMDILSDCLASGRSSRLYRSLVYEKQLAKSVTAYNISLEKSGIFLISCIAQSGVAPETLEAAIWEELHRSINEITEEELTKSKNKNEMRRAHSLQQLSSRNDTLQQAYTYTGDTAQANRDLERLMEIKSGDIRALAPYFDQSASVVLYTVPKID